MTNTFTPKQAKLLNQKIDKIVAALLEDKKQYMRFQLQFDDLINEDTDLAYEFILDVYKQMFFRNGRLTKNQVEFKKPKLTKVIGYNLGYLTALLKDRFVSKTKLTLLSEDLRKIYDEREFDSNPNLSDDEKTMWKLAYTYEEFLHMHQFYYNLALNASEDDEENSDSKYYQTFVAKIANAFKTNSLRKFEEKAAKLYASWLEYATENYQYAFWEI